MNAPANSNRETLWRERNWLITGASTGLGKVMAETVLRLGGRVIATARDPAALAGLVANSAGRAIAVALDVTKPALVTAAVHQAEEFGGIDVLVNNAGYGFQGGVEESEEQEIAAQLDVNFFGALRVIRAALPGMRKRSEGFIVNISSISGVFGAAGVGFYSASKFALEGMSESLGRELEPFGIRVMIVEPGPFRTDFAGRSLMVTRRPHPAYPHLAEMRANFAKKDGKQAGDPVRGTAAIILAMESEKPPTRLVLGRSAYDMVKTALETRLGELEAWRVQTQHVDYEDR